MKEKIEIITKDFEEKEKKKLDKFMASLALCTEEELKNIVSFLNKKKVSITKASQIKVIANTLEELQNKFSVVEQAGASKIFEEDPNRLNSNVIDIYKRITYCKQNNIEFQNEDGSYKEFLFSATLWKNELELNNSKEEPKNEEVKVEDKPAVEEEAVESPSVEEAKEEQTNAEQDDDVDYYEKIRAELEETRKALSTEFLNFDFGEEELTSFDEIGRSI